MHVYTQLITMNTPNWKLWYFDEKIVTVYTGKLDSYISGEILHTLTHWPLRHVAVILKI